MTGAEAISEIERAIKETSEEYARRTKTLTLLDRRSLTDRTDVRLTALAKAIDALKRSR